jgi:two-component system cell cycle response regulator
MRSGPVPIDKKYPKSQATVLLASPDWVLIQDLLRILNALGFRVETVMDADSALAAIPSLDDAAIVLLDVRLIAVSNGRLLAGLHEPGLHEPGLHQSGLRRRFVVALIADEVSDEWIARLREGIVDDIVPRQADAASWSTHLSTMRRGHQLYCELEELREASVVEVQRDRLTGIFNRETMVTLLFRETDRVQRLRGALCLVLFDIDDFGHWNQELGQLACDAILREVSTRTGAILRSYDLLGRTGSNEFLLALPGCSTINAVMMAERMRMEVFGEPFILPSATAELPLQVRLTACFGITASHGRSPVVVLREAEQTLARSKQSGPDSILCASDSPLSAESSIGLTQLFPEAGIFA